MNANIIDVFDEIVLALLKSRHLFSNAVLHAAVDRHPVQQSTCMWFALLSVRPERFDFRVLDIAAQNIAQSNDIRSREFVQPIALPIMCVDAYGVRPSGAVFAE